MYKLGIRFLAMAMGLVFLCSASAFGAAGDVDSSGGIDLKDAITALRVCVGLDSVENRNGDANNDDKIGLEEAIYVLQTIAQIRDPAAEMTRRTGDLGKPYDYDLTMKDFRDTFPDTAGYQTFVGQLPSAFDWRDKGVVTPAKNQGSCGSCWAFASTAAFEAKILMAGGPEYDLSEQQQVSCNSFSNGCCGGRSDAVRFWYNQGPLSETCTDYDDRLTSYGECGCDARPVPFCSGVGCDNLAQCEALPFRTTDYYSVDTNDANQIRISIYEDGPAYFAFDVWSDFDTFWDSGFAGKVYTNSGGSFKGGHAVLIIGWDDYKQAWLCKNSWGESAGPNGNGTFWIGWWNHANNLNFRMANFRIIDQRPPTPEITLKLNVFGGEQAPIKDAEIRIFSSDDTNAVIGEGTTDENGESVIAVPFAAGVSYVAEVKAEGFKSDKFGSDFVTGDSIGETEIEGYIFLYGQEAVGRVMGIVIAGEDEPGDNYIKKDSDDNIIFQGIADENGNVPMPNVLYEFYRGETLVIKGNTDAKGRYDVSLSPGFYRLEFAHTEDSREFNIFSIYAWNRQGMYYETEVGNIDYSFGSSSGGSGGRAYLCPCPCCDNEKDEQYHDADNDGIKNSWEIDYGLDLCDPTDASLDSDNDGFTNLQEFELGTNPTVNNYPMPVIIKGIGTYYVDKNESTILPIIGYSPTGGHLKLEITSKPANGTLSSPVDLNVEYTPETDFIGNDSFTFRLRDITGRWSEKNEYGSQSDRSVSEEGRFEIKVVPIWKVY